MPCNRNGPPPKFDHAIKLDDSFVPQRGALYALSPAEEAALDSFIEENLSTGRIRPSKSPQASSLFFAKKEADINAPNTSPGLRPVIDYRYVNKHTEPDRYPLPLLEESLQSPALQDAKYFTVLDIRWGFNNIRIQEGDEWKAAFNTKRGLFEPTVMFFGLCNSPPTFQRFVNNIFIVVLSTGKVFIYVDDILIAARTLDELYDLTCQTLEIMRAYGLTCKPAKCQFEKESVKYLGNYIGPGSLSVNPEKIRAIAEWPTPKNVKDIERFLGTCNFWRKYILKYSDIARPLNNLRRKDTPWTWTTREANAFEQLKKALIASPVLKIPIRDAPYRVEPDASGFAIASVLSQKHNGQWHPVAFYSKTLTPAERNWSTPDQELFAIVSL